jgi:hypothetical protein
MQQPSKQINLRCNCNRLDGTILVALSDDSSTVPLEESVENAKGRVPCNLEELVAVLCRLLLLSLCFGSSSLQSPDIPRVGDDFRQFGEVEHDIGNRALSRSPSARNPAQNVTEGDETGEFLAICRQNGQLVEALVAHKLDCGLAGVVGSYCGYGLESEGANSAVGEDVFLVVAGWGLGGNG